MGDGALVAAVPVPEGVGGIKAETRPVGSGEKRSLNMAVKSEFVNPEEAGYVHKFRWGALFPGALPCTASSDSAEQHISSQAPVLAGSAPCLIRAQASAWSAAMTSDRHVCVHRRATGARKEEAESELVGSADQKDRDA